MSISTQIVETPAGATKIEMRGNDGEIVAAVFVHGRKLSPREAHEIHRAIAMVIHNFDDQAA